MSYGPHSVYLVYVLSIYAIEINKYFDDNYVKSAMVPRQKKTYDAYRIGTGLPVTLCLDLKYSILVAKCL